MLIGLMVTAVSWPAHVSAQDAGAESAAELFAKHCAVCHGAGGQGTASVPDLTDGVWQFGGSYKDVERSIINGRSAVMPGLGIALGEQGLDDVVAYVRSLSGAVAPAQDKLAGGKALYSGFCASCHGENGAGTPALGARNLTNGTWLYGGSADEIRAVVANGRASDMPAQRHELAPKEISLLTTYVRSLGNAQSDE